MLTAVCGFDVPIEGLIVTVNAADVTIKTQPLGVSLTWRKNLAKWLLAHGAFLTVEAIDTIYEAARRSTTWQQWGPACRPSPPEAREWRGWRGQILHSGMDLK